MQNLIERFKLIPRKTKITVFSISTILIITYILIIIIAILNAKPSLSSIITVTDYSTLPISVPEENQKNLSIQLYYQLSENFEVPEETNTATAIIRPDTFQNNSDKSNTNISFIADVDKYQQSYRIHLSWANDGSQLPQTVSIECAENSLSKYPGILCYGMYMNSDSIDLYLPYSDYTPSGRYFTVRQRFYGDETPYLEIAIDSCGDQAILDEALQTVKEWLKSNYLNPDDYSFETPAHYCAGGAL